MVRTPQQVLSPLRGYLSRFFLKNEDYFGFEVAGTPLKEFKTL
jgi:hypothetical protein